MGGEFKRQSGNMHKREVRVEVADIRSKVPLQILGARETLYRIRRVSTWLVTGRQGRVWCWEGVFTASKRGALGQSTLEGVPSGICKGGNR